MRTIEKMTRSERREIEVALASEIARIRRVPALLDFPEESKEMSEFIESEILDGTRRPESVLQRDARYQSLTKALRRLRDGTYGQCVYCGEAIPTGRLLAIPETEHCLGCGAAA
jgi:RNA polymerase-binding transcription factor DksA